MPRTPYFMPLLLLLLLLSLPHTQAAFPQDPLPLLTSDLQGQVDAGVGQRRQKPWRAEVACEEP